MGPDMDFGKIVGLFDREFFVGYLNPVLLFGFQLFVIGQLFQTDLLFGLVASLSELVTVVAVALVAVSLAVTLMIAGPLSLLLVQGYVLDEVTDGMALTTRHRDRYRFRLKPTVEFQERIDEARGAGKEVPKPPNPALHRERMRDAVENYPENPDNFLPFMLGNVLRAGEVHPRVVYGLDAVGSWERLQPLLPEAMSAIVAGSRSQLMFFVNLFLLSLVSFAALVWLCLRAGDLETGFVAIALALFGLWAILRLTRLAGRSHMRSVAACYDLYRSKLADQLGLAMPLNASEERQMWIDVTRVFQYRSAKAWERLDAYRKSPEPEEPDNQDKPKS
jgi:hypothetical protein